MAIPARERITASRRPKERFARLSLAIARSMIFISALVLFSKAPDRDFQRRCWSPAEIHSRGPIAISHRPPSDTLPAPIEKFRKLRAAAEQERVHERNGAPEKGHAEPWNIERRTDRIAS